MAETFKIKLRGADGKVKTFEQKFIPTQKMLDLIELQDKTSQGGYLLSDYRKDQVKFLADLFDDPAVTEEAILNGLNALDFNTVMNEMSQKVTGTEFLDPKVTLENQ
ncbi:hypothetical protein [Lactobacillus casei subsp. casei ATCC 393] [Lactiplantibacillus mudanjiangensis]|uniref:phage tail assembly chaperone G n=1 Tax=Lactiplantibacillus mudanjiangensis TaxID=1296538 RepID=UPI00101483FE|nr:hypothetical protein [Lactobacillus casei subsp. casei ATCC 393] [Lactiplantibacillus mudanjiangensis]